jgi:hypothetical protein
MTEIGISNGDDSDSLLFNCICLKVGDFYFPNFGEGRLYILTPEL